MKKFLPVLAAALILGLTATSYASIFTTNSGQEYINAKNAALSGNIPNPVLVGGDNIGTAVAIGGLPYSDGGNTCSYADDYDEICPFSGSTSGDVVYSYTPGAAEQISIDLCTSLYDTKVYVYENAAGNLVACNDDAGCGSTGFMSRLDCVAVTPGNTYYIVVDGYFGDCGDYTMDVFLSSGCPAPCDPEDCPPGAGQEGEPVCGTNYVDAFNGGCNSIPNVFSPLDADDCVCGEGGTYSFNGLSYRDTDWYELTAGGTVTASVCAEFDVLLGLINGDLGCGFPVFDAFAQLPAGTSGSVSFGYASGTTVWVFVATSGFAGVPCGAGYVLTVGEGCTTVSTENTSWGAVKGLYR
jgi:hypothetical protein